MTPVEEQGHGAIEAPQSQGDKATLTPGAVVEAGGGISGKVQEYQEPIHKAKAWYEIPDKGIP